MITILVNHKSCTDESFLIKKQIDYTYAFHKVYKSMHKITDINFQKYIKSTFNLTEIEFRSLVSEVKSKFEKVVTEKSNKEDRIIKITKEIEYLSSLTKSNKINRKLFKLNNKVKELEDSMLRDITFGGKENLRKLSRLHNKINKINLILNNDKRQIELSKNLIEINKQKELWSKSRILSFYLLGESNQKGNRFFDFDFENKKLIYKPYNGKKIEIIYSCFGDQQEMLLKLQNLINTKSISVTLNVSSTKTSITFDDKILSGYYIDKSERNKDIKFLKDKGYSENVTKGLIEDLCRKYQQDLKSKKIEGKIPNRYMAIDMNPEYIGFCISDKKLDDIKVIKKGLIDLRLLNEKLGLPSDDPKVKKQNNKRKNELINSISTLFRMAKQYKVSYFIKEDIDNIGKNESFDNKTSNRKVRNIWHRGITEWQIEKRCISLGIELVTINPVYTSFIGNMMYDNFDATNASIEICRRGMFKYNKGLFYPKLTGTNFDTMSRFQLELRDVQDIKDCKTWVELYRIASNNGLRWRWDWNMITKPYLIFSMNNVKSKVNFIIFD